MELIQALRSQFVIYQYYKTSFILKISRITLRTNKSTVSNSISLIIPSSLKSMRPCDRFSEWWDDDLQLHLKVPNILHQIPSRKTPIHKKDGCSSYFLPKVPPNGQFVIYALNTCSRGLIEFRRKRRYVKLEANATDSLKEKTSTVAKQLPIDQFNTVLRKLCQGKQVQITVDC